MNARPVVSVVIASYRRPALLARALESLREQGPALAGVVVVNNSSDDETRRVAAGAPVAVQLAEPSRNLGTGGGVAFGLQTALKNPAVTHAWIMDDDATATPGALEAMLAGAVAASAEAVMPLVLDAQDIVRWFPGPLVQPAWDAIRRGVTADQFRAECGIAPLRWNWAPWPSLLISRRAIEAVGWPREDFWFQSTDIEYTLRLSHRFTCALVPTAICRHLPPPESAQQRRAKDLWTLQNNALLSVRLRHGRRALRHLPGNHYRYWKSHGRSLGALGESCGAFLRGAVLGRPAGVEAYRAFVESGDASQG